jgi:SAM-dependent methyltransferase
MPVLLDARSYGSDRDSWLLAHYANRFGALVDRDVRLLEIGSHSGSLSFWADYFPQGRIVGLDVEPVAPPDQSGRVTTYQGRQDDTDLLTRLSLECAPDGFDIIVDDASHVGAPTRIAFWHLFKRHLKGGGLFVIEDWGTGYWPTWPDGRRSTTQPGARFAGDVEAVEFPSHVAGLVGMIKELVDEVGSGDMSRERAHAPSLREPLIDRLEILPGVVFVTRAATIPA